MKVDSLAGGVANGSEDVITEISHIGLIALPGGHRLLRHGRMPSTCTKI